MHSGKVVKKHVEWEANPGCHEAGETWLGRYKCIKGQRIRGPVLSRAGANFARDCTFGRCYAEKHERRLGRQPTHAVLMAGSCLWPPVQWPQRANLIILSQIESTGRLASRMAISVQACKSLCKANSTAVRENF